MLWTGPVPPEVSWDYGLCFIISPGGGLHELGEQRGIGAFHLLSTGCGLRAKCGCWAGRKLSRRKGPALKPGLHPPGEYVGLWGG